VDLPLKRYGLFTNSNPAGATVSDPQKTPETLESLAQKLAFTQKTLEDVREKQTITAWLQILVGVALCFIGIVVCANSQVTYTSYPDTIFGQILEQVVNSEANARAGMGLIILLLGICKIIIR
jgi:glucose-6-phosphate 1-dehydrogenase